MANGCLGCLMLFVGLLFLGLAITVVGNYWPIILGLGLSWASLRYLRRMRE